MKSPSPFDPAYDTAIISATKAAFHACIDRNRAISEDHSPEGVRRADVELMSTLLTLFEQFNYARNAEIASLRERVVELMKMQPPAPMVIKIPK